METSPRSVLVTGGAQGLGKGMVSHFAARGWRVAFVDIDSRAVEETSHEISDVEGFSGDVTEPGLAERVIGECQQRFGRVDALINNAGVSRFVPIDEMAVEQFRRVLEINLVAYWVWTKAAVSALRESRGAIVNIASTRALQSEPHGEAYAASKGGVVALTHALAISLGPEVRVNAISPGWIETGPWQHSSRRRPAEHSDADRLQHPVGRVGSVEDIAQLAEFLCGEQSGFITGQNYVVDGGMTRKMIYV
jgi:NAD(P)-dependent dehydrogenase (short-subunit alcohol dehydrogenase family)